MYHKKFDKKNIYKCILKILVIDYAHYLAQLLWVIGNIIWAGGDLFYDSNAAPIPLFYWSFYYAQLILNFNVLILFL